MTCQCWNRPAADPHCFPCAARDARASVGARMVGDLTSEGAKIAALDAQWSTTAFDVTQCPLFTVRDPETGFARQTTEGVAFDADFAAWKAVVLSPPTLGADSIIASWQTALATWQTKLVGAGCKLSGNRVTPPPPPSPEPPSTLGKLADALPFLAIAGVALAVAYTVGPGHGH